MPRDMIPDTTGQGTPTRRRKQPRRLASRCPQQPRPTSRPHDSGPPASPAGQDIIPRGPVIEAPVVPKTPYPLPALKGSSAAS